MELNGTITAGGALYGAFGTDSGNYNDLRNKPSINGVELVGNKTSEDLHIEPGGTTDYEDLENKPQINYTPLEGNLTLDDLDIQSKIDFPEDSLRFLDGAGQFRNPDYFSGDYDDLANRPEIAGITLTGDKSLTDLGIQEEINFPSDNTKYLDGEGNFTTPAYFSGDYDDLANRPEIAGITLTGDKSLTDLGIQEEINFPSDNTKYLDGEGNFTTPAYFSGDYDDLANRPEIAGITLTGNQSLTDLGIQAEIDFPEDNTLYLDGNGNFTQPNYFSGDYDDLTDKPQINSVTLEGNKTASDLKLISEMHTASGSEAAIETDDTLPLLSCVSDINPVQDLHGYSKPWAGGAGKNLLDTSTWRDTFVQADVTFTKIGDGHYKVNGTANATTWVFFIVGNQNIDISLPTGTYTLSARPSGLNVYIYRDSGYTDYVNGAVSITSTNKPVYGIRFLMATGTTFDNVDMYFQIEENSTMTDWEPYSNICPISGHTDVTVTVASTSGGSGDDYTVSLGSTYYGGTLGVTTGELEVTWENIASYAGETLPGEWLSSLDEYTALGTPTTGAQVVYELATPQTFTLTKEQIITLLGDNYIRSDTGDIEITYVTNVIDPLFKYLLENR